MYLAKFLNEAAEEVQYRAAKKRDYIPASMLGKPYIDAFFQLKGIEVSNPMNSRAMRKMNAGVTTEELVANMFLSAGIIMDRQVEINCTEFPIRIFGYTDFVFKSKEKKEITNLPEFTSRAVNKLKNLEIEHSVIELKSVSSFGFDKIDREDKPIDAHVMQLYAYVRALGIKGYLLYVCRDDWRAKQFLIDKHDEIIHDKIQFYLNKLKYFLDNDIMPDIAPQILWNDYSKKFTKNLEVEYSPFLTMLYGRDKKPEDTDYITTLDGKVGYKEPEHYREYIDPIVRKLNTLSNQVKKEFKTEKAQENQKTKNLELLDLLKQYNFNFTLDEIKTWNVAEEESEQLEN